MERGIGGARPLGTDLYISIDIRRNDTETPHLLDFFNTFGVQEESGDPNVVFTSAGGRSSSPAAADVPEPATSLAMLIGLATLTLFR